jgi:ssRNA-specific RNase YbeY (16S rRNA maturation enzyme)
VPVALIVDPGVALAPRARRRLRLEVARMVRAAALTAGRRDLELALRLTTDPEIRALNRDHRGKDRPTDVLAFAQQEGPAAAADLLGDLVISVATCSATITRPIARSAR